MWMVWPARNLGAFPLVPGWCVVLWKSPTQKNVLCSDRLTCWALLIWATLCRRPQNWSSTKLTWGSRPMKWYYLLHYSKQGFCYLEQKLLRGREEQVIGRRKGRKPPDPFVLQRLSRVMRSPPLCDERGEDTRGTLCCKQRISLPAHFPLVVNKNLQNARQSLTCNQSSLTVRFFHCSSINSIFVN